MTIFDNGNNYTHRIGRTGRAERTGEAHTFAVPEDKALLRDIEKALGKPIARKTLPNFDYGNFKPENQFPTVIKKTENNRNTKSRNNRQRRTYYQRSKSA